LPKIAPVSVARATSALKTSTLIALGAFAVHQLRYLAGYGDEAGAALGSQGHAYLLALVPVLVVLAVSSLLGVFIAVALSGRGGPRSRGAGWAFCATALLVVFGVQESAEGLLSQGHPGGAAALLGHGGWLAVPIAIVVGRIVSLLLTGLGMAERRLAEPRPFRARRAPVVTGPARLPRIRPLACATLAFGFARRPPPLPTGQS
jgi:hypothetical protein